MHSLRLRTGAAPRDSAKSARIAGENECAQEDVSDSSCTQSISTRQLTHRSNTLVCALTVIKTYYVCAVAECFLSSAAPAIGTGLSSSS